MLKKLIEVALPLEAINKESAREKSIRHGHPSTLHLWWARRPLAAARAVIWSSLVDDPSSHPEQFPTEEEQNAERERLFRILEKLVVWENSNNPEVLDAAKAEIMKSTGGNPPALLDPFAGGGAIPLEAQRLGLEAHAHDLNPVAVMINKAMIEIPPKFAVQPPVHPGASALAGGWRGAAGLAEDVRYYGEWMKQEAFKRIGHLYPKVKDEKGKEHTVIAWIWARTVKCPNPACGCKVPLASNLMLSKKKGNETWIEVQYDGEEPIFQIRKGKCPKEKESNKCGGRGTFRCLKCGETTTPDYTKKALQSHSSQSVLMAIVAEGSSGRIYFSPTLEQIHAAQIDYPDNVPRGSMSDDRRAITPPDYGMPDFADLFTNRQLTALTTFCKLAGEAQAKVVADGGSEEYGQAVGTYLTFAIDRLAMTGNSLVRWNSVGEKAQHCFGRQALPMLWDYAEPNFLGNATGCISSAVFYSGDPLNYLPAFPQATVHQFDAQSDCGLRNVMISTDPPYYDNVGYSDLSDFFYVWMRQCLKETLPNLFKTMLAPKSEELVAVPYRFGGSTEKARAFFEKGMLQSCKQIYQYACEDVPVTIYYAYKQSETDEKQTSSSGWETMLSAIVQAGFAITGTWPMRTEMKTRQRSQGSNALASSIVLVCRKRPATSTSMTANWTRRAVSAWNCIPSAPSTTSSSARRTCWHGRKTPAWTSCGRMECCIPKRAWCIC